MEKIGTTRFETHIYGKPASSYTKEELIEIIDRMANQYKDLIAENARERDMWLGFS